MSRAERFALAGALILVLLHAATGGASGAAAALEYRHGSLGIQPWRALTGHFVHVNWPHALINAAAWFIVARLFAQELKPARQAMVLVAAALVISAGLLVAYPQIEWYRGFSGVLHALFFTGASLWLMQALSARSTRTPRALWLPAALTLGGWVKVLAEQPWDAVTPHAAWLDAATVPQAHLFGAACGTVIGLLVAWRESGTPASAREKHKQAEQE